MGRPMIDGTHVNRPKPKVSPEQQYLRISAGKHRGKYVHTLVAEAKIGRSLFKGDGCTGHLHRKNCICETVEHINGDGLDTHYSNLRVVRVWENTMLAQQRRKEEGSGIHNHSATD